MKTMILPILLITAQAYSQEASAPDSVAENVLNEISVVARNQRADSEKTVYIPDSRQRSAASDGISLLSKMNIPQLDVNPIAETVKTADNQGVSLFINHHQASKEDVAGLNPQNVRRVEYLDFPTDPRFMRAQHVVNFITKETVFGGYTKVSAKERLLIKSGDASVYSKFSYKAMEYDLMVNANHDNNPHIGNKSIELYKFPDKTIERIAGVYTGQHHENNLFAGIRASWNKSEKLSFRNMLSIRSNRTPYSNTEGSVEIIPGDTHENYTSNSNLKYLQLGWESDLYASFCKGWSLNGNLQLEYADNHSGTSYNTAETDIVNNAHEKSLNLRGNIQINKAINDRLSLFSNLIAGGGQTEIDYTGSNEAFNRFTPVFGGASAGAAISVNKVSGSIDGGFAMESSTINGKTVNDNYPFTHVNLQYAPNEKNSIGLWFQYAAFSPDAAMKNPNMIQQNELLYITGNPDLKCSKHISTNISYTLLPGNNWQLSAYATMFRIINRQAPVYTPASTGCVMIKKYMNDGDYNHGQVGARLAGKFMGGRLAASVAPRLLLYRTTGANSTSHYPLSMSANVDYYAGDFFFNLFLSTPNSYVDGETCYLRKIPCEYSLSAGWSAKGWNIQLSAINIFRSSWRMSDDILQTKWFDSKITQSGSDFHRRISVSVSYTLNYGRKVNSSNELMDNGGGSSSILK
ncbi:MAG: outer membrane beta-barrel family protein [Muribaculaceae bacterium]